MERLTAQQRAAVGKMSDDRLRLRLVQAGYQAEDVGRLDRQPGGRVCYRHMRRVWQMKKMRGVRKQRLKLRVPRCLQKLLQPVW